MLSTGVLVLLRPGRAAVRPSGLSSSSMQTFLAAMEGLSRRGPTNIPQYANRLRKARVTANTPHI